MDTSTIHTQSGEEFEVVLDELPASGYVWRLDEPLDGVELLDSHYTLAPGVGIGGGGKRHFRLRTRRLGRFVIEFKLRRAWETTPLERYTIVVVSTQGHSAPNLENEAKNGPTLR
jgi:predicted secreted protein